MLKFLSVPVLVATLAGAGTSFILVPPARDDGAILAAMALRDSTEIVVGQLAMEKGQSAATKAYGRALVRDHTAHIREVRALAGKVGASVAPEAWSAEMKDDGERAVQRLRDASASEFDAALADFAYEAHAAAIKVTEEEHIPQATNAQVKALARKTLGSLRSHLAGAKANVRRTTTAGR